MTEPLFARRLRTPAAAEYLGLAVSTLEKMRVAGNGPKFIKAGPRAVVYDSTDLDAWLDARRQTSTSDQSPLPTAPASRRRAREPATATA